MAVSTNNMIKQLAGLVDSNEVTKEDNEFIKNLVVHTQGGTITNTLTEAHYESLRRIWHKHFAG
jgi:uncharacterized protein (DUF697 family)